MADTEKKEELKKEETKKEDVKTSGGNGEDKKEGVKVGWWIEGNTLRVIAPLDNGYMSLGILYNALSRVNDMIEVNRLQQQQNKDKLAGKDTTTGKDTMREGIAQNPSFFKKIFK